MNAECEYCGQTFEPEPGYYFGAMFVSYIINVAIFVAVWFAFAMLVSDEVNIWWLVLASVLIGLILVPVTFRLSRLVWINMFVKYDPEAKKLPGNNS
jgi:hypothetical protein